MAEIEETIIAYVAGLDETGAAIGPDTPLLELGLLDSINLVQLIQYVEEQFSVSIADGDIGPEIFATPAALSAYVARRLA
ncbi:MAG: acyl carrier protein [Devosia sp.]|jgi:acyl carrier protein|nr:acyl carrier protein [Devosiaceae bacterium]